MNLEDFIPTDEICTRYKVEHTFVHALSESGLIHIVTFKKTTYVHCDEISEFEKLRRLHYELNINLEGLEAVQNLLGQVERLQNQNIELKNKLDLYD